MLSRRDVIGKLAAGTAAALALGAARSSFASVRPEARTPTGSGSGEAPPAPAGKTVGSAAPIGEGPLDTLKAPQPWEMLRPLTLGSMVGQGWRLTAFQGVVDGSCVVTLQNERGRAHRVHLCRNDGNPQGLVYTKHVDLVVMNGGQGDLPTEEGFAQAVAELAHVLASNETGHRQEAIVTALLPQNERLRRFAGPADRRLR